jgi:hypothetical protein
MSNNYTPNYQKPNYPPSTEEGGEKPYYDNSPAVVAQAPSYQAPNYAPPQQNYYYNNPQYNAQNYQVQASPVNSNYYPPQNQNIYYQPVVSVNNDPIISSPLIPAEPPVPQNSIAIVILNFVLIGISIVDIILQAIFKSNTINLVIDIINLFFSILIIILYYCRVNLKHPCVGSLFMFLLIVFFMMGGLGLGLGLADDDLDDDEAAFFVSLFTGVFFLMGRTIILFFLFPLTCNFRNPKNRFN